MSMRWTGAFVLLWTTTAFCRPIFAGDELAVTPICVRQAAQLTLDSQTQIGTYWVKGSVLHSDGSHFVLYDETGQLYVESSIRVKCAPGDIVMACCQTNRPANRSNNRIARALTVRIMGHGVPTPTRREHPSDIICGDDFRLVELEGVLTSVSTDEIDPQWLILHVEDALSVATAWIRRDQTDLDSLHRLVNAKIRLNGLRFPFADFSKRRHIGPWVLTHGDQQPTVLTPPPEDPFADHRPPPFRQVISGHVTARWDANRIFLATDGDRRIEVRLAHGETLPALDSFITLAGFIRQNQFFVFIVDALISPQTDQQDTPRRTTADPAQPVQTDVNGKTYLDPSANGHETRVCGRITEIQRLERDAVDIRLDCNGFFVTVRACPEGLTEGARIEATGICRMTTESDSVRNGFTRLSGIQIITRGTHDIRIVERPSWWTRGRLLSAIVLSMTLFLLFLAWNIVLRELVRRHTREALRANISSIQADLRTEERTRLALELHDTIAQNLTGASFKINAAAKFITRDPMVCRRHIELAERTVSSCRNELRNCIWDLRSDTLSITSLDESIRQTIEPHVGDATLDIRVDIRRDRLSDNTTHALLRILRELALNAVRHGQSKSIAITGTETDDELAFTVSDNGLGFDPAKAPGVSEGHFGLQGIYERVRKLGGSVQVISTPGKGTRVLFSFTTRHSPKRAFP